jgi:hypothetical protein
MIFGPLANKASEKVVQGDEMQKSGDPVERYLGALHSVEGRWFVPMALFLALIWLVYPVNFFLEEQEIGLYTHPMSDAVYTVSDVVAKVVYGFVLLGGVLAIERRAATALGRSPKVMSGEERDRFEAEFHRHEGASARHKLLPVEASFGDGGARSRDGSPDGEAAAYEIGPEGVRADERDDAGRVRGKQDRL